MRIACCSLVTPVVLILGVDVMAADLPAPINFRNLTGGRIVQTVSEDAGNNVKEVGYGDIDNDGDLDVVIGGAGGIFGLRRNKLYRNDDGVFNEVSGTSIIPGFSVLDLTRHVFILDYDGDGWNDIAVANDDLAGGGPFKIYMNQHPGDVFSHFTEEGSQRGLSFEASCGAISEDVDGDGDMDLYSGNYPGPSQDTLYLNDGNAQFTVHTSTRVPDDGDYTIDVAAGDLNGNGKLDLLISNHNPNYIYYNDKLDEADQGVGDYKYGTNGNGGRQNIGNNGADGAMECGDFNNDGRLDYYYSNKFGATGDRIMMNQGNDLNGMAVFTEFMPPSYVTQNTGNKITVGDLNDDGRVDILVGMVNNRPAILRNTSVNGAVSFVDWTSGDATAFPSGQTHRGHHGTMFDTNGDGDIDIFMGGRNGDHLFESVPTPGIDEDDLKGGMLPSLLNRSPRAITGRSSVGESDVYTAAGLANGAFLSVVLNGPDDYLLEVLSGATVVATSDRGGLGIEEAMQYSIPSSGTYSIRVTINGCEGDADINGDCQIDVDDLVQLILDWGALGGPSDINNDGIVNVDDIVGLLIAWGPILNDYQLEVLSRTG